MTTMKAFPLLHKKMQRLTLPYIEVGTCEMMNLAGTYNMESFHVFNDKNCGLYREASELSTSPRVQSQTSRFLGEMVGGGLLDSYTGREASTFVSNYLAKALSMHTVLPEELRKLRREDPSSPLVSTMIAAMVRRRGMRSVVESVVDDWDFQQYAMGADAAFFSACDAGRRQSPAFSSGSLARGEAVEEPRSSSSSMVSAASPPEESGCRGIWFSAAVAPSWLAVRQQKARRESQSMLAPPPQKSLTHAEASQAQETQRLLSQTAYFLDVLVGGVGNSRAFGVARNPLTKGMRSLLDPSRECTVPLSVDHTPLRTAEFRRIVLAGGKVDSAVGEIIDGNPYYNVARSFGHWSMKNAKHRSPIDQKMIALPTVMTWRMLKGDALVLCNHAIFETRNQEDGTIDELAKVVGRGLSRGSPAEAIAASLCDFAVRFGAEHSLQAMVAVARGPPERPDDAAGGTLGKESSISEAGIRTREGEPSFAEWVEPGPLYVGACRRYPAMRRALQLDCSRLGVTLDALLRRRWEHVREMLPSRHFLPLLPLYGKECGALQQVMDEEADFFDDEALRDVSCLTDPRLDSAFHKLAKLLQVEGRGS